MVAELSITRKRLHNFVRNHEWLLRSVEGQSLPVSLGDRTADPQVPMQDCFAALIQAYGGRVHAAAEAFTKDWMLEGLEGLNLDVSFAKLCPPDWMPEMKYVVVDHYERVFIIATDRPSDLSLRDGLMRRLAERGWTGEKLPVLFFRYASPESLDEVLPRVKLEAGSGVAAMVKTLKVTEDVRVLGREVREAFSLKQYVECFERAQREGMTKVPEHMLNVLLAKAYSPDDARRRASDVHLMPGPPDGRFVVYYRVNGVLEEVDGGSMEYYRQLSAGIKNVCHPMVMTDYGKFQDGRYTLPLRISAVQTVKLDVRAVCMPSGTQSGGDAPEKFVFRILDSSTPPPTLEQLFVDPETIKRMRDVLNLPLGLILLTGPTGCGKSTTLARFMSELSSVKGYSIYTVEDPVEYEYGPTPSPLVQVQVDRARGIDFPLALRYLLRADPDIILVGEMRDAETVGLALQAALTGHQVFSTLHTNDVVGAVSRLMEMGAARYLIADTVKCVIAQRLVKALCRSCSQAGPLPTALREVVPAEFREMPFYQAAGCSACSGQGRVGRVAVTDYLYVDQEVRGLLFRGADLDEIRKYNEATYSPGLLRRALQMASQGIIDVATALSVNQEVF